MNLLRELGTMLGAEPSFIPAKLAHEARNAWLNEKKHIGHTPQPNFRSGSPGFIRRSSVVVDERS